MCAWVCRCVRVCVHTCVDVRGQPSSGTFHILFKRVSHWFGTLPKSRGQLSRDLEGPICLHVLFSLLRALQKRATWSRFSRGLWRSELMTSRWQDRCFADCSVSQHCPLCLFETGPCHVALAAVELAPKLRLALNSGHFSEC